MSLTAIQSYIPTVIRAFTNSTTPNLGRQLKADTVRWITTHRVHRRHRWEGDHPTVHAVSAMREQGFCGVQHER